MQPLHEYVCALSLKLIQFCCSGRHYFKNYPSVLLTSKTLVASKTPPFLVWLGCVFCLHTHLEVNPVSGKQCLIKVDQWCFKRKMQIKGGKWKNWYDWNHFKIEPKWPQQRNYLTRLYMNGYIIFGVGKITIVLNNCWRSWGRMDILITRLMSILYSEDIWKMLFYSDILRFSLMAFSVPGSHMTFSHQYCFSLCLLDTLLPRLPPSRPSCLRYFCLVHLICSQGFHCCDRAWFPVSPLQSDAFYSLQICLSSCSPLWLTWNSASPTLNLCQNAHYSSRWHPVQVRNWEIFWTSLPHISQISLLFCTSAAMNIIAGTPAVLPQIPENFPPQNL